MYIDNMASIIKKMVKDGKKLINKTKKDIEDIIKDL
jgi:hypothetical protein